MKIFLGISGASGVNLGLKLAREIAKRSELHLCVSKNAMSVLEKELNFTDIFYKNGVDVNFQNLEQNLTPCNENDSHAHKNAKFANFSSAQGELDFGGGDERSQNQSGKFTDNAQDLSDNGLKFAGSDNYILDANWQIYKSNDGEKNASPNDEIASKFDDRKFQKQCGIDRNRVQKDAKQDEIYQIWQGCFYSDYIAPHRLGAYPAQNQIALRYTALVKKRRISLQKRNCPPAQISEHYLPLALLTAR